MSGRSAGDDGGGGKPVVLVVVVADMTRLEPRKAHLDYMTRGE